MEEFYKTVTLVSNRQPLREAELEKFLNDNRVIFAYLEKTYLDEWGQAVSVVHHYLTVIWKKGTLPMVERKRLNGKKIISKVKQNG